MRVLTPLFIAAAALTASLTAESVFAADVDHSTPGLSGYDPVAYFTDGKAMRGSAVQMR